MFWNILFFEFLFQSNRIQHNFPLIALFFNFLPTVSLLGGLMFIKNWTSWGQQWTSISSISLYNLKYYYVCVCVFLLYIVYLKFCKNQALFKCLWSGDTIFHSKNTQEVIGSLLIDWTYIGGSRPLLRFILMVYFSFYKLK